MGLIKWQFLIHVCVFTLHSRTFSTSLFYYQSLKGTQKWKWNKIFQNFEMLKTLKQFMAGSKSTGSKSKSSALFPAGDILINFDSNFNCSDAQENNII